MAFFCAFHDEFDLKPYYWPGMGDEVKDQPKFLDARTSGYSFTIGPKGALGNLFRPGIGFINTKNITFERQPFIAEKEAKGNSEILGFALMFMPFKYHRTHLPFLLPFTAMTDKEG